MLFAAAQVGVNVSDTGDEHGLLHLLHRLPRLQRPRLLQQVPAHRRAGVNFTPSALLQKRSLVEGRFKA